MKRLIRGALAATLTCAFWSVPGPAQAEGRIAPAPEDHIKFDSMYVPRVFVRRRVLSETHATFWAPAQKLRKDAVLLMTVESVGDQGRQERWRCVAIEEVEECLSKQSRFRYLKGDRLMVLTTMALPKDSTDVALLLWEDSDPAAQLAPMDPEAETVATR